MTPRRCAIAAGLLAFAAYSVPAASTAPVPTAQVAPHPLTFYYPRPFARAVTRTERAPPRPMPGVRALIIPHHWLAGHLIVGPLRDLAATGPVRRVILIGPNHIGAGGSAAITSRRPWTTPFGEVSPDRTAIDRLIQDGVATDEPSVLSYEHSVAGIVPVVAHALKGASLIPIIVSGRDKGTIAATARAIASLLTPGTVLVASVDFSHYRSAAESEFYDAQTLAALRTLDEDAVLGFGNEHLDAPAAIAVLMRTMRIAGATSFVLRDQTNSSRIGGSAVAPNVTSYISGYYH